MLRHSFRLPGNLVVHPRYGETTTSAGSDLSDEEIVESCWGHGSLRLTVFPESAIRADISKQGNACVPRQCYVDQLCRCRDCERPYLFYALQQKHWYEELGFNLAADCVRCPECRQSKRRLRRHFQSYSGLIKRDDLGDLEVAKLAGDAIFLARAGVLKSGQKLGRIKNRAVARIPSEPVTKELVSFISESRERGGLAVPGETGVANEVVPAPPNSPCGRASVMALTWEPAYRSFYMHARSMGAAGMTATEIRSNFSTITRCSKLGGAFGAFAQEVGEAVEDALADRPMRPVTPPES
ncbi:zinc-ribbon domain containing protein [Tundrisphaera lichenicola]|uniref:zinc-ribbon domain containing protein n=1 Tax=Tundrisphaera lichenicola TaxID=2029860 RepID=UPI003EB69C49